MTARASGYPLANFITQSGRVDNWNANNVTLTTGVLAPDGTTHGATVAAINGAASHYAFLSTAVGLFHPGDPATMSVYVKAGTSTWILFGDDAHGSFYQQWFNVSTGAFGTSDGGVTPVSVDVLPNGWFRVSMRISIPGPPDTSTLIRMTVGPTTADATRSYNSNGLTCVAWGGQVVRSNVPGPYLETAGAASVLAQRVKAVSRIPVEITKPTQIAGCDWWLRADLGVTLNGSDVSAWADQSGSGFNASQGTSAQQPAFIASGQNSKPAIRGHTNASKMSVAGMSTPTSMSLFVVLSKTANASVYVLDEGVGGAFGFIENFVGSSIEWFNGNGLDRYTFVTSPAAGYHILQVTQTNGLLIKGYYDGKEVFSAVPTQTIKKVGTLFGFVSTTTNGTDGDIPEVCRFSPGLPVSSARVVTKYLADRYAIAITGP